MNDRHAFVTGAAGGIGRAIAARLLDDGFTGIVLADLRAEPLEATARALDRPGARILTVTVDVADRTAARRALTDGRDRLGSLDVLVNAAGLYPSRLLAEMGDEEWDRVLDVNLNGPFVLSTAFARQLIADKRPGHIVNITSGAADRARRGGGHYCTSKAALTMLTKALALELAPHRIHVNAVSPGFIPVSSEVNPLRPEYVAAIEAGRPWPRQGTPEDVAAAVSYLCSADAEWITGTVLHVDGGTGAGNAALPLA